MTAMARKEAYPLSFPFNVVKRQASSRDSATMDVNPSHTSLKSAMKSPTCSR
jgi:hypothetical protein